MATMASAVNSLPDTANHEWVALPRQGACIRARRCFDAGAGNWRKRRLFQHRACRASQSLLATVTRTAWCFSPGATPAHFAQIQSGARNYSAVGAYDTEQDLAFTGRGMPEVVKPIRVTSNFLEILGVSPLLGNGFGTRITQSGRFAPCAGSCSLH
jgi:hypothetical protein